MVTTDSAVSSSEATSFLKLPAVRRMYQNGTSISPTARTGTRKALPNRMAAAAPTMSRSMDTAQTMGNLSMRPDASSALCASKS